MLTTKRAEPGSISVELTLNLALSLLPSRLLIVYFEEQSLSLIYLHWRKTRSACHTPPLWSNFQNLFVMSRQQMGGLNFCFHTVSLGTKQHSPSRLMEISHWKQWTSSFPSAAHPTLCENTEECGGPLQGRPSFKQFYFYSIQQLRVMFQKRLNSMYVYFVSYLAFQVWSMLRLHFLPNELPNEMQQFFLFTQI